MRQGILKKIHPDLLGQDIHEIILNIFCQSTHHCHRDTRKQQDPYPTNKFTGFVLVKLCDPVIDDESKYLRIK